MISSPQSLGPEAPVEENVVSSLPVGERFRAMLPELSPDFVLQCSVVSASLLLPEEH